MRKVLGIGAGRGNPFPNHYGFEIALDKLGGDFYQYTDEQLIPKIQEYNPTHIIVLANISATTSRYLGKIRRFRQEGVKIGWWFWDLREANGYKTFVGWQDYIFLCNLKYKEDWRRALRVPVVHMPQCSVSEFRYRNDKKQEIDWDFYFMGSFGNNTVHGRRREILARLLSDGKRKLEWRNSSKRNERIAINHTFPYLYANSPIVLDISADAEGYTSNRAYDILAAKGFMAIKWFKGIEKMFKDKVHCVYFKTVEDLYQIADYYEKHPEEREKIKEQGHQLFLEKHTFEHRLNNMLDILDGKETKYRGYIKT